MSDYDFLWWVSTIGVHNSALILGITGAICGFVLVYALISNT